MLHKIVYLSAMSVLLCIMSSCEKEERNFYDGLGKKPVYVPLSELRDIRNELPRPIQLSGTIFLQHFPQFLWILLWLAACERPLPALKVPVKSHYDSLTLTREYTQDTIITLIAPSHDSLASPQQLAKQMAYLRAAATRDLAVLNCTRERLENQLIFCKLSREGLRKSRQAYADMQKAEQSIQQWIAQYW